MSLLILNSPKRNKLGQPNELQNIKSLKKVFGNNQFD